MRSRGLLAVVSALGLIAIAGVLEGCSSASAVGSAQTRVGNPATAAHRRAAIRDARRLLADVVAPSGAVARSAGTGTGPHARLLMAAFASAVAYRTWTVAGRPSVVLSQVVDRLPKGSELVGSGRSGPAPRSISRTYQWPAVPGVLGLRWLEVTVTARAGGGTLLAARSQSQWLVARPRSERIPPGVREVEISDGLPRKAPFLSRRVTNRVVVHRLVALVDSLGIIQPGAVNCPAQTAGPVVSITFRGRRGHAVASVRESSSIRDLGSRSLLGWSCSPTTVRIKGHAQPSLAGDLIAPIQRLLHITLPARAPRG
jgi:hypothetical protein